MVSNKAYQQNAGESAQTGRVQVSDDEEKKSGSEPPTELIPLPDDEFKDQLAQVIPHLRAFGRSLSGSRDLADDLVIIQQIDSGFLHRSHPLVGR